MSDSSDRLKAKLTEKGISVKNKTKVKESNLKAKDIETMTVQMLKDFGYVE